MKTTNLGFPIVYNMEIKRAIEAFWKGEGSGDDIKKAEGKVFAFNEKVQEALDLIPVFDSDIYDRLLKTAVLFGLAPRRFGSPKDAYENIGTYLSIGRGTESAPASPMVKWFNTNYHVVQPEIETDPLLLNERALPGVDARHKVCLIGPWTFLEYSINKTSHRQQNLFQKLADQYAILINQLPANSIVQLEEPSFIKTGIPFYYANFLKKLRPKIHLHVYFSSVKECVKDLFKLPVDGIGLDFIDGPENLELINRFPKDKVLIAGVINGRNVWPVSTRTQQILEKITAHIADDKLYISPSCSLIHVPLSAHNEKGDFSFAIEKLKELASIKDASLAYRPFNHAAGKKLPEERFERRRKKLWVSDIAYPTTTIGSFPQTPDVRSKREEWKKGALANSAYEKFIKQKIKECIRRQEELGLDVLVHGEFERNDMVQYFAEHLEGFVPIQGWVQSYGTRYTRPPVIASDIKRPCAFTVKWISYAQSCTDKPVKGMLTGPVTIVQWSFPREDISREALVYQVAESLAEEVQDLVKAGMIHIQIDEPALREGLPLDVSKQAFYLQHGVNAFRRVYKDVPDNVVIHSHMCFSEFSEIIDAIKEMGVDVLSIEDSKAQGKTAQMIRAGGFPGSIGLGVFDVHSPRIPRIEEMVAIPHSLNLADTRIWINPDCGLKTRGLEAYEQLKNMIEATQLLRKSHAHH